MYLAGFAQYIVDKWAVWGRYGGVALTGRWRGRSHYGREWNHPKDMPCAFHDSD